MLTRILGRLNVVVAELADEDKVLFWLAPYAFVKGKVMPEGDVKPIDDPVTEKEALSKFPVVMAVRGHGVITKDESAGGAKP